MSKHNVIEWTGNIQVHHPIQQEEPALEPERSEFMKKFDAEVERRIQRYNEEFAPRMEYWAEYDRKKAA